MDTQQWPLVLRVVAYVFVVWSILGSPLSAQKACPDCECRVVGAGKLELSRSSGGKILGKSSWSESNAKKALRLATGQAVRSKQLGRSVGPKQRAKVSALKAILAHLRLCKRDTSQMSGQTPGITPGVPTIAPETEETKETPVGNAALAIIQDKCMSCHGSFPGSRKWINSWEYFRTNNLVVEGEPAQSSLYRYLTDNPEGYLPGYMPKGLPALSQSEIAVISAWIKSYGEGNASSGGSSGGMNNSGGGAGTNGGTPLPVFAFSCGDERALSPRPSKLKRLSKKQFQNTFIQLLDVLPPADRGSITVELLPLLDGIPDDIRPNKILEALEFPGMDGSVTSAHVSSLFTIASEFARVSM